MQIINPASLGTPSGYSNGIRVDGGSLVFVAGQVAWGRDHRIVDERFAVQFGQALDNVIEVVREAGGEAASIAKLTIFVANKDEYVAQRREVGAEYRRRMGRHYPAMSLVEVQALLEPGAKVEIEALAVVAPGTGAAAPGEG